MPKKKASSQTSSPECNMSWGTILSYKENPNYDRPLAQACSDMGGSPVELVAALRKNKVFLAALVLEMAMWKKMQPEYHMMTPEQREHQMFMTHIDAIQGFLEEFAEE